LSDDVIQLRPLGPRRKDPTAAERQKRFRERKKERRRNVTAPIVTQVQEALPVITEPIQGTVIPAPTRQLPCAATFSATVSALALATVSAGFSITGLTSIFIGAFWPVIAMGVALEAGKLSAVGWLARHRATEPWRLRTALVALVAVLMALNAIGAYGFLAKAHIGHAVDGDVALSGRTADADGRIEAQKAALSDIDRRIAQIDGAVDKAISKARSASAMRLADDQRKTRADLVTQRTTTAKALTVLQVERAGIEGQRRVAEADLGPTHYIALLVGIDDETVLRWFILIVAMLLDPAAVLLLTAASLKRKV
jgi:hypothetical protein